MLSNLIDATTPFNANGVYVFDMGGWDYCVIQIIGPAAAVSFLGSNDGGAITGSTNGNPVSATNFTAIQFTNIGTGSAVTSSATAGMFQFNHQTKYIQLSGTTAGKVLIYLQSIN
jgi:hypothetical protein